MTTKKAIGTSFAAIIILVIVQVIARLIANVCAIIKIPAGICNIIGGIIYAGLAVSENVDTYSVMTYVLNTKAFAITGGEFAITGGEFGIEASVISLAGYIIVAGIALIMIKSGKKNAV